MQVGLYFLSLYLFWFAVERLSGSGWFALAATLPLPWAGVMTMANVIKPDFLAAVATIVAISCLTLLVTGHRGSSGGWVLQLECLLPIS